MDDKQRRKLRHDILGSLNSIKLSTEVIKSAKDRAELLMFVECIENEIGKVEDLTDHLIFDPANAPVLSSTFKSLG